MTAGETLTIVCDGTAVAVAARAGDDRILLSPADLTAVLGWELKPEGLCRGHICIPIPDDFVVPLRPGTEPVVDLIRLAALLQRSVAVDPTERAAYLGAPRPERAAPHASLVAPDFTLPDLEGRIHSLVDHRGRKVMLIAYASW